MTTGRTFLNSPESQRRDALLAFMASQTPADLTSLLARNPSGVLRQVEARMPEEGMPASRLDSLQSQETASQWDTNLRLAGEVWGELTLPQRASLRGVLASLLNPESLQSLWSLLDGETPLTES
jgi:hypothetical protein